SSLLVSATPEVVDNAVQAANALGTLDRCADPRLLRSVQPPPDDADARARVERVRRELAAIRALSNAGGVRAARTRARVLLGEARGIGYAPALAEVLAKLAPLEAELGDFTTADTLQKEAFWLAEEARHDELKAEVATDLVTITGWLRLYRE